MNVLGVDPGVRGGLCVVGGSDGRPLMISAIKPDMTERDLAGLIRASVGVLNGGPAMVEKVGYMPGDGGKGAFTFGRISGFLRGALVMSGVIIHDVAPMVWQYHMGCLTGGNKNVSKNKALVTFLPYSIPAKEITHSTADAMLIARYGWGVVNRTITVSPVAPRP